ncbi:sulfate ABC transporter permease subunit CysT [Deinococcus cellulosilyticus]|uniref:Sulfate transport system permease protein CysT n=1 Tax=Deinococcus cellulosilyticus (strain DSM 18568 / NBRC 106333 / KACC 11606 / 5516J-15) TaxID=1223518 RepID=A0A511MW26_DEIC1|nr:sulfate ABC transporter permease subunit CysT [Deinococcus cellulosilyticus]GEM44785.1 sulfate ABC transporter permease [Deinococcus cellulosilyticus NBRC 106333 = KACC 11606]
MMTALTSPKNAKAKGRRVIPGFHFTLFFTLFYLLLIVLVPLGGLFIKTATLSWSQFWEVVLAPRVLASFRVTFSSALIASLINIVFGLITAWVLVRYQFPFKKLVDAFIDLPFALPTAVAGITLTSLLAPNGWVGQLLVPLEIKAAYSQPGIIIALTFIGLPFVVRSVQPVLEALSKDTEEAAESLGASRGQVFFRVILPEILPAVLTGFTLAFARTVGEYGSVIFISGNMPMQTEIIPLLIVSKLEQYDYTGATAIATVMLVVSFVLLLVSNILQARAAKRLGAL